MPHTNPIFDEVTGLAKLDGLDALIADVVSLDTTK